MAFSTSTLPQGVVETLNSIVALADGHREDAEDASLSAQQEVQGFLGQVDQLRNEFNTALASVIKGGRFIDRWNAATNTPAIPNASEVNQGHYYIVNVAGGDRDRWRG